MFEDLFLLICSLRFICLKLGKQSKLYACGLATVSGLWITHKSHASHCFLLSQGPSGEPRTPHGPDGRWWCMQWCERLRVCLLSPNLYESMKNSILSILRVIKCKKSEFSFWPKSFPAFSQYILPLAPNKSTLYFGLISRQPKGRISADYPWEKMFKAPPDGAKTS